MVSGCLKILKPSNPNPAIIITPTIIKGSFGKLFIINLSRKQLGFGERQKRQ